MGGDGLFIVLQTDLESANIHFNWVKGENPTFLKPTQNIYRCEECSHACHASAAKAAIISVATSKFPIARGCKLCNVWEGKHNK